MSSPVRIWTDEEKAKLLAAFTYDAESGKFFHKVDKNHGRHVPVRAGDEVAAYVMSSGYMVIGCNGGQYPAHRLAWLFHHGEFPELHIDHIDHDRSNNKAVNLRMVMRDENQKNKSLNKLNTSGTPGVVYDRARGKWMATICIKGKKSTVGRFEKKDDATLARWIAEKFAGFHPNHGKAKPFMGAVNA